MKSLRLIVLGVVGSEPFPGVAWQAMQYVVGLCRLGHDVHYFETTSAWPYDPRRNCRVSDSDYAVRYVSQIAEHFGLAHSWAYRRSYGDKSWFGLDRAKAEDLLAHADAVLSITGSTRLAEEGLKVGRLVYVCTDPVIHEVMFAAGHDDICTLVEEHNDVVTFGENIGTPLCPLPVLPRLRGRTRQPVVTEMWQDGTPRRDAFTTVGNWKQHGRDSIFLGETYTWSKHHEYLKIVDLPLRSGVAVELATELVQLSAEDRDLLKRNGWHVTDAHSFDLSSYRDYIQASKGEFTVAKDANVRLCTGWFSDRSACYLAAGRPVITQDTGFGAVLPTGEGLFAFRTIEDILSALELIQSDFSRHSQAARQIAEEYFKAETVLSKLLADLAL